MEDFQSVYVVAGCVIEKDGKYLLVQENNPRVYGLWGLPAGKLNKGESFEEAAKREVKEETGLDVVVGKELSVVHFSPKEYVLHAYASTVIGGTVRNDPKYNLAVGWFSLEEIRKMDEDGTLRSRWILDTIEQSASMR